MGKLTGGIVAAAPLIAAISAIQWRLLLLLARRRFRRDRSPSAGGTA